MATRAKAAVFRFVGADLRRDILSALLTIPLSEAMRNAERIGFTSHEITAAIGTAQQLAAFSAWDRKT